ncbi:dihydropteroate synthase [Hyphomonas johnsonii]|uniref:Dihydropteroate synthase n=1 Tax=Hyphomonas johnsonii MHS-2 TaxID=1280950 RepID=A0A059FTF0_9PROT|nr:dihydropteroate synthase [Hyphomonas johnsonii]KCZ93944.1 dihydropteroate synthase [Hyphomonas johnsonii MHS-2]
MILSPVTRTRLRDGVLHAMAQGPVLMGILNVTPDSFSDGGAFVDPGIAIAHARAMLAEGAGIIDVGGESTRPGAEAVSEGDETRRVMSVIPQLLKDEATVVSIDTYKASVARAAAAAGAVIINDVWGMTRDTGMADAVAQTGSLIVVTYNRGQADSSLNLVDDMRDFFDAAFVMAARAGIPREHVLLDPGVGFGKTWGQNLTALSRLDVLVDYGVPVLVGVSRKSFIGRVLDREVGDRLSGTLAAGIASVQRGASVLRVHDVAAHADALKMLKAIDEAR